MEMEKGQYTEPPQEVRDYSSNHVGGKLITEYFPDNRK